jgi:hypothetical protein
LLIPGVLHGMPFSASELCSQDGRKFVYIKKFLPPHDFVSPLTPAGNTPETTPPHLGKKPPITPHTLPK